MKRLAFLLLAAFPAASFAQWDDVKKLGTGGEAYVSTDGKGHVYATSHQPAKLYVSSDFGKTFSVTHDLPDAFCDVTSAVGPDGRLYVIYIQPNVKGMKVMLSSDNGQSIQSGGVLAGSFDREWIIVNPVTGNVGYNYSDGYIGGPPSKGVFYAASKDQGKTFRTLTRIDKEPEGSLPVDPYLAVGTGGRIYAAWATTRDQNTIDSYKFASSDDGGATWANHTTIARTNAIDGDTQERWMLGSLVAVGKDTVMAVYQDYGSVEVDGRTLKPLLAFYRLSTDGGKTWSDPKTCQSDAETKRAMRSFFSTASTDSSVARYVQTLPWVASDPSGRVHMAFVDNRAGQKEISNSRYGLWQVRYSSWATGAASFTESEQVSGTWVAERPPLDFIGIAADAENAWVIWTQNPERLGGWDFSGDLFIGHKKLPKPVTPSRAGGLVFLRAS